MNKPLNFFLINNMLKYPFLIYFIYINLTMGCPLLKEIGRLLELSI